MARGTRYAGDGRDVGAAPTKPALRIATVARAAMLRDAAARHPHEACGMLFAPPDRAADRYVPLPNVDPRPHLAFALDPLAVLAAIDAAHAAGREPVGVFHSHPDGPATPSALDLAGSWPELWMVIASPGPGGWRLATVPPRTAG